jgi:lipopolysaccharide export system protein LptA
MVSPVSRLRWWFALGAILMVATVAGMYFYARLSLRRAVREVPAKLGLDIQQTADGFSISKSVDGRTQFTVSASKAVQFKEGSRADLHNVKIIIYGKDASRFDQITGDDFEYDPTSGNVNAKGTVLIDLEANPEGIRHSDQSPPEQRKEPIHLETNGLIFNKNTGDASASGKVVFRTPQASGSAVGVDYVAKTGTMNLLSAVVVTVNRPQPVHLTADRGVITKLPHQVFLTTVHMARDQQEAWSDQATFFLRENNTVDHILAEGDVRSEIRGGSSSKSKTSNLNSSTTSSSETHERSDRAELFLTGSRNLLTLAILTGNVHLTNQAAQNQQPQNQGAQDQSPQNQGPRSQGPQPAEATAGRVTLHFAGEQILKTVHAEDGVRLSQNNSQSATLLAAASPSQAKGGASSQDRSQDIEMTAPVMDFIVTDGRLLQRADTSGPPRIVITQPGANQKTVVTAAKFTATFTAKNRISTLHGEPDAKIVSGVLDVSKADSKTGVSKAGSSKAGAAAGQTDRVQTEQISTSQMLDVAFLPEGGVRSITQTGSLTYVDGTQKAWAQRGEYTTADQLVVLTGSPRVVDGGMTTTAQKIRMNRATGDALAEGNVKSTYSDLKAQPDGAMLASSDPIHVTSRSMTANRSTSIAVYTGDARLWQDANIVEAPTLQFDRDHRSLFAQGLGQGEISVGTGQSLPPTRTAPALALDQPVSTVLVQVDKTGKVTPVHITSARLNYADAERRVFLDGGVTAKEEDATMTAQQMTVFLLPRSQSKTGTNPAMPGQVDRIIAEDRVVMTQPTRHAAGDRLLYTSVDDRYVLTGGPLSGPPSIFDAERGKTTGDSLTFYRHDDRVLVEGRGTSPAVTRTQVAR